MHFSFSLANDDAYKTDKKNGPGSREAEGDLSYPTAADLPSGFPVHHPYYILNCHFHE